MKEFPSISDLPKEKYLKLLTMKNMTEVKKGEEWYDDSLPCFNYSFKADGEELIEISVWWLEPEMIANLLTADKLPEAFKKVQEYFLNRKDLWEDVNKEKLHLDNITTDDIPKFSKKDDHYEYYCEDREGFLDIKIDTKYSDEKWIRIHNKKQVDGLIEFLTELNEKTSID